MSVVRVQASSLDVGPDVTIQHDESDDTTTLKISCSSNINFSSGDECVEGFFGNNCAFKCRFPNYGKYCQLGCNCSIELCDHILGCPNPSAETTNDYSSATNGGRSVPSEKKYYLAIARELSGGRPKMVPLSVSVPAL
ncbi:uncharacterized protein LOC144623521 isoform X2 [Crassostrea virginica]